MPNGDLAADFNGHNQYFQVADSPDLSVPETGVLTLEAWIRPDALQPSHEEGTGYVNFLGKSATATSTSASTRCACTPRSIPRIRRGPTVSASTPSTCPAAKVRVRTSRTR